MFNIKNEYRGTSFPPPPKGRGIHDVLNEIDTSWLDEPVEEFPGAQRIYRFFCFLMFKRRMTYSNIYVLTYAMYKKKYKDNEKELKEKILKDLAAIYLYNNGKLPEGFEFNK